MELAFDADARAQYTAAFDEYARTCADVALRNKGRYLGVADVRPSGEAIFGPLVRSGAVRVGIVEVFLNLGLGELLGLVGAISAGVVALYLLDRSKRRQIVATLRFWTRRRRAHGAEASPPHPAALEPAAATDEPGAAAAGDRRAAIGRSSTTPARDHVLMLDTSAWMGSRAPGQGTLLDQAKSRCASVPAQPCPAAIA